MYRLLLLFCLQLHALAYAGTANCDADSHCQRFICPKPQQPYCDIIPGTTGPNGKAMGFCKCRVPS